MNILEFFIMFSPSHIVSEVLGTDEETSFEIFVGLITAFVGLLILVIFLNCRKSGKKSVYILGVSDAGKTTLLSRLVNKTRANPVTVTSQTANVFDEYLTVGKNKILRLIDVPGADKVRSAVLLSQLAQHAAAALVFVVDSTTVVKDSRAAAEWLYSVLADELGGSAKPPPLLIACTKQDAPGAKSARAVRTALEREFDALHRTRRATPDATGVAAKGGGKRVLAAFEFDRLPNGCRFVECSAAGDSVDVQEVEQFLDNV